MTRGKCSGLKAPIRRTRRDEGREGSRERVQKRGRQHKVLYSQEKDKHCSALEASACADDEVGLLLKWTHTLCSLTLFEATVDYWLKRDTGQICLT